MTVHDNHHKTSHLVVLHNPKTPKYFIYGVVKQTKTNKTGSSSFSQIDGSSLSIEQLIRLLFLFYVDEKEIINWKISSGAMGVFLLLFPDIIYIYIYWQTIHAAFVNIQWQSIKAEKDDTFLQQDSKVYG